MEAVPINDERRASLVFQFAQDNIVTPQQGEEGGTDRTTDRLWNRVRMSDACVWWDSSVKRASYLERLNE